MAEWAKVHTDILGDSKLMRAARKGAVGLELTPWLIVFAKSADDGGRLTVNGDPAELADLLPLIPGSTEVTLAGALLSLTDVGVLVADPDSALRFVNWDDRQAKPSDSRTAISDRVKRHRDNKLATVAGRATPRNGTPVTPGNALQALHRNATEGEEEVEEEGEHPPTPQTSPPDGGSVTVVVGSHANGNGKHARGLPAVIDRGRQALADLVAMGEQDAETDRQRAAMTSLVFAYWAAKLRHATALQDPKRERVIAARLKENRHDVSELLFAVDGARRDRNLMGENERGRKYDGVETIFRDRGQVERLAALAGFRAGSVHPQLTALAESVA